MKKFSNIDENIQTTYKVGIDIHGVIDRLPGFFSFLSDSIIRNGGEVHIITGGTWDEDLINELKSYNIKWTHHFSVYDYMIENFKPIDGEVVFSDGTKQQKFKNSDWNKSKGDYCKKHNINFHIDDKDFYSQNFFTPFALLK